jgi:hypothetical protein
VIDGAEGTNVRLQQGINQAAIVVEAFLIHLACAFGQDARP